MKMQMFLESVPVEALERGLRAAAAVFDKAQLHPYQAARAAWEIEGWDVAGFPEPVPDRATFDAAEVWQFAGDAALRECCPNPGDLPPTGPGLGLLIREDQVPYEGAAVLGLVAFA